MSRNLLIGFGTETGNSELLAMDADRIASSHGIETRCACLDEVQVDDIKQHEYLLIICSTWGVSVVSAARPNKPSSRLPVTSNC